MAKYQSNQLVAHSAAVMFTDPATKELEARMPLLDSIRGQLIIKAGMFATLDDAGAPCAGYAKHGWSTPDRKALAKAVLKGQLIPVALPQQSARWTEGYIIAFADGDAQQFGCDLSQFGEHVGVMAITADALAQTLTGKALLTSEGSEDVARRPLTAIALADGLAALRSGFTKTVPAYINAQGVTVHPELKGVPAFPEGVIVHAGNTPVEKVDDSPLAQMLAGKVQVGELAGAAPAPRAGYGMGGFQRRGRGRS